MSVCGHFCVFLGQVWHHLKRFRAFLRVFTRFLASEEPLQSEICPKNDLAQVNGSRFAEPRARRSWVDNTPLAEWALDEARERLAVLSERASGSELASASPVGGTTCSMDLSSTVLYIYIYM